MKFTELVDHIWNACNNYNDAARLYNFGVESATKMMKGDKTPFEVAGIKVTGFDPVTEEFTVE